MAARAALVAEGRQLYRSIMRIHRTKLPAEMRSLGDSYVKKEFRTHLAPEKCKPEHFGMFLGEWRKYVDTVGGQQQVVGVNMSSQQKKLLNKDQKKMLKDLEHHAANPWD